MAVKQKLISQNSRPCLRGLSRLQLSPRGVYHALPYPELAGKLLEKTLESVFRARTIQIAHVEHTFSFGSHGTNQFCLRVPPEVIVLVGFEGALLQRYCQNTSTIPAEAAQLDPYTLIMFLSMYILGKTKSKII